MIRSLEILVFLRW